jgi:7-keto-8-aminopelargonate synthetase-like enzyme
VHDERVVQTISLSKAFGVYGGAILGSQKLVADLQEHNHIFKGNTPLPLPLVSAAHQSVRLLRRGSAMRRRLARNTARLKLTLARGGFPVLNNTSPIVALVPSSLHQASRVRRELLRRGVFPSLIRYADGPPQGFFRFAISSEHTTRQVDILAGALLESAA